MRVRSVGSGIKRRVARGAVRLMSDSELEYHVEIANRALGKGYTLGEVDRETRNCLSLCRSNGGGPLNVADVGANVGDWTAAFLARMPDANMWLFEPSGAAYQLISDRWSDASNVHCIQTALGSVEGTMTLFSDRPGSPQGTAFVRPQNEFSAVQEEVSVRRLDDMLAGTTGDLGLPSNFDIVKLDVEGMELDVLRGGIAALRSVAVLQFEFGGTNVLSRTFFRDFYSFLGSEGFVIYRDSQRGLKAVTSYDYSFETFATVNYWARRTHSH